MSLQVLYEDNHLIAVLKPAGVLVQGDITGDECLMDWVKKYLKEKYQKPGKVFLGLLHRLDRPVSGIVLFAKTSKGASRLSEQIRLHQVKKEYHALVEGKVNKKKDVLVNYLYFDKNQKIAKVFEEYKDNTQIAELSYEVVEYDKQTTLLKILLKTGRHHQIRAQLSHLGHPIVGDMKYGSQTAYQKGEIALSATLLSFTTATTNEHKIITIKPSF